MKNPITKIFKLFVDRIDHIDTESNERRIERDFKDMKTLSDIIGAIFRVALCLAAISILSKDIHGISIVYIPQYSLIITLAILSYYISICIASYALGHAMIIFGIRKPRRIFLLILILAVGAVLLPVFLGINKYVEKLIT